MMTKYKGWEISETDWQKDTYLLGVVKDLIARKPNGILTKRICYADVDFIQGNYRLMASPDEYVKDGYIKLFKAIDECERNNGQLIDTNGNAILDKINRLQHNLYGNAK